MSALLFGSISSLADTSELQRAAFNEAFDAHGVGWRWDREEYQQLLTSNGGEQRIADYALAKDQDVDAAAIHATKSEIFQKSLATAALSPRRGVVEAITTAKATGWKVGLVTTTSRENVDALVDRLGPDITRETFDVLVDSTSVDRSKPDPAAYLYAIERLGERPQDCVALEDNVGGVQSANAAGVNCFAFPNTNTAGHHFGTTPMVDHVSFTDLTSASHH